METFTTAETAGHNPALEELRAEGRAEAEAQLAAIDGFDDMDYREKYAVLQELLNDLNTQETRFAAQYIAAELRTVELESENARTDAELASIRDHYAQAA